LIMAAIRYFIPEDGDTEDHPNVFLAPKPRQSGQPPLLRDIKSTFPLPGKYHFRFKTSPIPSGEQYGKGNNMAVWMDCLDENRPVPLWRNSIIAKITRTSPDDDDDDDDGGDYVPESSNLRTNGQSNANFVRTPQPERPTHVSPQPTPVQSTESLLYGFGETPAPPPTPTPVPIHSPTPTSSTGSLLDMGAPPTDFFGGPTPVPRNYAGTAHNELLSMGMQPMAQQQPPRRSASTVPQGSQVPKPSTPVNRYPTEPRHQNMPQPTNPNGATFESFSQNNAPFGNLNWS